MFSPATKKSSSYSSNHKNNKNASRNDSRSPTSAITLNSTPTPRLSVLARMPALKSGEKSDSVEPVYIGELPQGARTEQHHVLLQKRVPSGDTCFTGGMDKETSLAWFICGNKLFIWNYLSSTDQRNCIVLDLPSENSDNSWLVYIVSWVGLTSSASSANSAGLILCNRKNRCIVYWPNIYSEAKDSPITSYASSEEIFLPDEGKNTPSKHKFTRSNSFNTLIASPLQNGQNACIALASSLNGELWQFVCNPFGIMRKRVLTEDLLRNPRSLIWHFPSHEQNRQFLILTDHEIQCYSVKLIQDFKVSKLWSHEIVITEQKRMLPLDLHVDEKVITILIAIIYKDRSYTEYSLLTMQYNTTKDKILEKKSNSQVIIIPKARIENEDFLFSMKLKTGGKPNGSVIILSNDGTATISHWYKNSTKLYQFNLPYEGGKVLDASILPSLDDNKNGAWSILTEKAGIWAIPEQAILLNGVENEERVNNSAQNEESEALLSQYFNEFIQSGEVNGVCNKLKNSGAFDKEGELNVFVRASKSIVDTLAKHWTTTRGGAEIIALNALTSQLLEKHQKHQSFLQFLALSKCHQELSHTQRESLHIIMEHGEKLACMIKLRELQNTISQNRLTMVNSGTLWDLIQLVGEKTRRNTILLMDRDNSEVFYSKVSDLQEIFSNLDKLLSCNSKESKFQIANELSNTCVNIIHTAMNYRTENQLWYPSLEGLIPWFCQSIIRGGLWTVGSFMLQLLNQTHRFDEKMKFEFYLNLQVLVEVLLEVYSNAITAKTERGEENKSLLLEYWNKRDLLLKSLYTHVKELTQAKFQEENEEKYEILRKLLSIAKRHEGYETMWNICSDLNDMELLKNLMHYSMGPKGGFSYYVFEQLHKNKQYSQLLRLGEEFQEELASFLKQYHELFWLHQVFLHRFSSASLTLHELALLQSDHSEEIYSVKKKITLSERKRFLKLSKIAALAGKEGDYTMKIKRIDADLKILQLQEYIASISKNENFKEGLVSPIELIETCLKSENRELSLLAFKVFAWTSISFIKCNTSLLEECWKNAANQDNWEKINEKCLIEGWGEEETISYLSETILYKASKVCYGDELVESFEGGFNEVFPLRQSFEGENVSVEQILMQHNDYADSGKLMLMAICCVQVNNSFVVPMEG